MSRKFIEKSKSIIRKLKYIWNTLSVYECLWKIQCVIFAID